MPEPVHYDLLTSIDVPAKDGVVVGLEADRVAWARDAFARLQEELPRICDDGRVLVKVAGVTIARKPGAAELVSVTLNLHFVKGGNGQGLSEAEAKRQFWLHVTGAWAVVREGDARAAGASVARTAA